MNMFQNKLQLGVAAATVMGISMVSVMPAQALNLVGDDRIDIIGSVDITNGGGGNYDFAFQEFENSGQQGLAINGTTGKFAIGDNVGIADISLPNAGAFPTAPLQNFITDILLADGTIADFNVNDVTFAVSEIGADSLFTFVFDGSVITESGQVAQALGSFSAQSGTIFLDDPGETAGASFSGTLRIKRPDEIVPTPAAILPTLLGMGGFAAKRKKQEEEA